MTNRRVGRVYFLEMNDPRDVGSDFGLVKVGITWGDVAQRISTLQTGNPFDLRCSGCVETRWPHEVEHFMHRAHASDRHRGEWLKCTRQELRALVDEARDAARQVADRKTREEGVLSQVSNGQTRQATIDEVRLHIDVRKLMKEFIPAVLRMSTAKNRLKAATGTTLGVPGIVESKYLKATIRFSPALAQSKFAPLASECFFESMTSSFHWRSLLLPKSKFIEENRAALAAQLEAKQSADEALRLGTEPTGWTDRTPEVERWHDDYLKVTALVQRRKADIADIKSELKVSIGEFEAIDGICSFKRTAKPVFDSAAFYRRFPNEAEQCAVLIRPRLRKRVYSSRSYLPILG
jgi:hypothetical protein